MDLILFPHQPLSLYLIHIQLFFLMKKKKGDFPHDLKKFLAFMKDFPNHS